MTAPERSTIKYLVVDPYEIHFLCFTLQAYEGIATVTTIDAGLGLVQLNIAPGCEDEVGRILETERDRLRLRNISM